MSTAAVTTGFFGKIPATGDFVASGLPRNFIDRWDRWMSRELQARPDEGELDSRIWRFMVPAGIFCDQPCAGAWRMSEDRVGRRYPFAVVMVGVVPEPADAWFDAAAAIVYGAVAEKRKQPWIAEGIAELPQSEQNLGTPPLVFWVDDWEVQELGFADIYDLAAYGLPAMRAARTQTTEL
ncbi:type VI secretion system-associated protein TagF [Mesorhizobium sp. BR1-1-16]|uniref:type VI secretion system-associated protein TagF n=1 Tax=Mesorhizobium sp. BR1-1-16 TaxID=2876653 RepID=UPI001CCD3438|nr:type VI secretion system-associated protein TagF [Mesorhizobium sp. BR1-1-16]MBZ9936338.1 type VI secretion system-associated protein TagF [Mesorhizobium sp. BR1-1-16]